MFIMFIIFNMHVHTCVSVHVCACVCAWDIPTHPPQPLPKSTHTPPQLGYPQNQ